MLKIRLRTLATLAAGLSALFSGIIKNNYAAAPPATEDVPLCVMTLAAAR